MDIKQKAREMFDEKFKELKGWDKAVSWLNDLIK